MNDKCPIWGTSCKEMKPNYLPEGRHTWEVDSPRAGGKYIISDMAHDSGMATALDELSKVKLSRRIYEQNQSREPSKQASPLEIDINTLKEVSDWPMPSALEQMDYCLQFLKSKTEAVGKAVNIDSYSDEIQAATLLKNKSEIRPLIETIRDEDWIKIKPDAVSDIGIVVVRRKGYQRLEELERPKSRQNRS